MNLLIISWKKAVKDICSSQLFRHLSLALLRGHHNIREQYVNMQNIPARIQTKMVVKETEDCVKAV